MHRKSRAIDPTVSLWLFAAKVSVQRRIYGGRSGTGLFSLWIFRLSCGIHCSTCADIDSSIMREMDNGSVIEEQLLTETVAPSTREWKERAGMDRLPTDWTQKTRETSRSIRDTSIGLNSFRRYTLFKKLASRVWPVGLAVIPCHNCTYSVCCLAVFVQSRFPTHISITSSL